MSDFQVGPEKERFAFGENWLKFLRSVDEETVLNSTNSFQKMLGCTTLSGKRFLDIGCRSGLSSLVARNLGAEVVSFDFDSQAVECTKQIRDRFRPGDQGWVITSGSILDQKFLEPLGIFDVVYSWGVLHHTGKMWEALRQTSCLVRPDGICFVAIYNDQGWITPIWRTIKRSYVRYPFARPFLLWMCFIRLWVPSFLRDFFNGDPFSRWRNYNSKRGMNPWSDLVDWVGGYPFEVAKPEEIFRFFRGEGFQLIDLKTCGGGLGCNEFVFRRQPEQLPTTLVAR